MKFKIFRALVAVVLVLVLLVNLSPIRAQALQIALPVGAIVGVGALAVIGTMMIANHISPGSTSTDFWSIARTIYNQLPASFKVISKSTSEPLLKAVHTGGGRFGISGALVEAVNNFIFTGTVTAVATAATMLPPVVKTPTFTGTVPSVSYAQALKYMLDNHLSFLVACILVVLSSVSLMVLTAMFGRPVRFLWILLVALRSLSVLIPCW